MSIANLIFFSKIFDFFGEVDRSYKKSIPRAEKRTPSVAPQKRAVLVFLSRRCVSPLPAVPCSCVRCVAEILAVESVSERRTSARYRRIVGSFTPVLGAVTRACIRVYAFIFNRKGERRPPTMPLKSLVRRFLVWWGVSSSLPLKIKPCPALPCVLALFFLFLLNGA